MLSCCLVVKAELLHKAVARSENPGEGARSTVVGIIHPPTQCSKGETKVVFQERDFDTVGTKEVVLRGGLLSLDGVQSDKKVNQIWGILICIAFYD